MNRSFTPCATASEAKDIAAAILRFGTFVCLIPMALAGLHVWFFVGMGLAFNPVGTSAQERDLLPLVTGAMAAVSAYMVGMMCFAMIAIMCVNHLPRNAVWIPTVVGLQGLALLVAAAMGTAVGLVVWIFATLVGTVASLWIVTQTRLSFRSFALRRNSSLGMILGALTLPVALVLAGFIEADDFSDAPMFAVIAVLWGGLVGAAITTLFALHASPMLDDYA